jgi:hypothetical protein
MTKMNKRDTAFVREAGRRAVLKYCKAALPSLRSSFPDCRKCRLSHDGLDCWSNPIGYRDLIEGRARADKIHEMKTGQREIQLPPSVGYERKKTE